MVLARLFGWFLLALASLMASGEAVLALGGAGLEGLSTREMWLLLAGRMPTDAPGWSAYIVPLLDWPAWTVIGGLGLLLTVVFRPRAPQRPPYPRRLARR